MLNTLFISGFTMNVNDGSVLWDVADRCLTIPGSNVFRQTWEKLHPDDLDNMDCIIAYSYGCSALWHAMMSKVWKESQVRKLFILAGVPRWLWGYTQGAGHWHIPSLFANATSFNVTPEWPDPIEPVSCPITNPILGKYDNINLNPYCSGFRHTSVLSVPLWQDTVYSYIKSQLTGGVK